MSGERSTKTQTVKASRARRVQGATTLLEKLAPRLGELDDAQLNALLATVCIEIADRRGN